MIRIFILLLLLFASFIFYLMAGSVWLPVLDVINELFTSAKSFTVHVLRLPRALMAMLVGSMLGVAGFMLQQLLRNGLASPDVIGITGGASVGAVSFMVFASSLSVFLLPAFAMLGGLIAAMILMALSQRQQLSVISVVLVGICLTAACSAAITTMLIVSDSVTSAMAYVWLTGTLYGSGWKQVEPLFWIWLTLMSWPLLLARHFRILGFSNEQLIGLGMRVAWIRALVLLLSVSCSAFAVAYAGAIGFLGLLAPHLAKQLVKNGYKTQLIASMLVGAWLLLIADLLGRVAFQPQDLPAGIFVAGVGGPFFVLLLWRSKSLAN